MDKYWNFTKIWNESIETYRGEGRKPEPRDYMYASELGSSYVDRYLKMQGIAPTNPPNLRSLRKFEAGNIWENIVKFVLMRSGILINSQETVHYTIEGLLPVHGRLDFRAGGAIDWQSAAESVKSEFSFLPESVQYATQQIVTKLAETYPQGLEQNVLEIKSCSAYMFELYERTGEPNPSHVLQATHYQIGTNTDMGQLVYICKDDCRMISFPISISDPKFYNNYKFDIEKMSEIYRSGIQPEPEKILVFDHYRFNVNWKVKYSPYISMLYKDANGKPFESQQEVDDTFKSQTAKWNRVLRRVVNGDKVTDKNKAVIDEINQSGFDFDSLVKLVSDHKAEAALDEEETEE